jgi:hypothetical protein
MPSQLGILEADQMTECRMEAETKTVSPRLYLKTFVNGKVSFAY